MFLIAPYTYDAFISFSPMKERDTLYFFIFLSTLMSTIKMIELISRQSASSHVLVLCFLLDCLVSTLYRRPYYYFLIVIITLICLGRSRNLIN